MRVAGLGSTVIAAPAPRRACQRMAVSAAAGARVSAASVPARCPEHLATSVKSAQHVETPAALQGESILVPSGLECRGFFSVIFST